MRLRRFRDAQDVVYDAGQSLGDLKINGLSEQQRQRVSDVLDQLDRAGNLITSALEMGS
jgi:hypothetical protein